MKVEAKRSPSGLEWGQTAQGSAGNDFDRIHTEIGGSAHGDDHV